MHESCAFINKREDALFFGPGCTGKSHLAQAIGQAAIQQGYRVLYRETHVLLEDLAEAAAQDSQKDFMASLTSVSLLIIDDFGMRKLPLTAAEDLLEIIMRRYERASTLLTANRPVDDWGKLLGDVAAVTAMLDRLLHHGHVLKCGFRSWRPPRLQPLNKLRIPGIFMRKTLARKPQLRYNKFVLVNGLQLPGLEVTPTGRFWVTPRYRHLNIPHPPLRTVVAAVGWCGVANALILRCG